jgi:hypothetical protein
MSETTDLLERVGGPKASLLEPCTCLVEWDRPLSLVCRPHRCELEEGHRGPHVCSCGRRRRWLRREME